MKHLKFLKIKKIKLNIRNNINVYHPIIYQANNILFNNLSNKQTTQCLNDLLIDTDINLFKSSHNSDYINISYFDSRFSQFESYISILNLFDFSQNFKKFEYKYKYSLLSKFIPFLIKNGKKLTTINNILHAIANIYTSLNNENLLKEYAFINEFKHYILTSKDTNNLNYLLNWIITIYKPVFDVKAFNIPKTSKKKTDKTLLFKIVYLPDINRLKIAFKHISLDIKKNNSNNFDLRISNSFLDILLNYKKSYLYSRKMYIYEQVMEL